MKAFWRNAALLAVSLLPFSSANAVALQAKQYGDFDRYVLALSWQTGFCQSQHDRNRNERDECRLQTETTNKADFLTVHGLWPGLPKSVAARGVVVNAAGCASVALLAQSRICQKHAPAGCVHRRKPGYRWKRQLN